ncbi:MAG TPA: hypothetical protein VK083_23090 [Nocardia sp.]|uniref:hypothetical protein n=1 Tax=Nocardia TaxID=1817 RepID=UPI002456907E|nr:MULTISPECIES: hypothetical protein [Nocardia]HLS79679.1 hypothetical protein [Nocardia sp.]
MRTEGPDAHDLVAAALSAEFDEVAFGAGSGGQTVDLDVLRRIHSGDFTRWAAVLESSGLFDKQARERVLARWREDQGALLAALLADADDVTRRRWLMAWSALDRPEPLSRIG